ncbi:hypothetical protein C4588_06255 [Candidatus Parcubacteria bacterium]|nr:MAG: hypothetical protein C4588_06255 [Candidatus Parcubacteria bacterium]
MKIEIEIPPGMWEWLKSQRNWPGIIIAALAEYRHRDKFNAPGWMIVAAMDEYRQNHGGKNA